jgi:hypothetical protein
MDEIYGISIFSHLWYEISFPIKYYGKWSSMVPIKCIFYAFYPWIGLWEKSTVWERRIVRTPDISFFFSSKYGPLQTCAD